MNADIPSLSGIAHKAIEVASTELTRWGDEGRREVKNARVTDISTKGDLGVAAAMLAYFEEWRFPAVVLDEELGRRVIGNHPEFTVAIDDIDGTDNYARGRGVLPYCTLVTIFDGVEPRFADARVAVVKEHRSGKVWFAERGKGCWVDGVVKAQTSGRKELDRKALVILDHYGSGDMTAFLDVYPTAWVKDFATAAFHLAGVSSGMFDAYANKGQKAHELGAGYLMIGEAGGVVRDWNGASLEGQVYDFDAKYAIVAAATRELGDALLQKIRR